MSTTTPPRRPKPLVEAERPAALPERTGAAATIATAGERGHEAATDTESALRHLGDVKAPAAERIATLASTMRDGETLKYGGINIVRRAGKIFIDGSELTKDTLAKVGPAIQKALGPKVDMDMGPDPIM